MKILISYFALRTLLQSQMAAFNT